MLKRHVVVLTADGSGNASGSTPPVMGFLESIRYIKNNFANGVDFDAYVGDATGVKVWDDDDVNASVVVYPRVVVNGVDGAAITGVVTKFPLVSDPIHIAIAGASAGQTGVFEITTSNDP